MKNIITIIKEIKYITKFEHTQGFFKGFGSISLKYFNSLKNESKYKDNKI